MKASTKKRPILCSFVFLTENLRNFINLSNIDSILYQLRSSTDYWQTQKESQFCVHGSVYQESGVWSIFRWPLVHTNGGLGTISRQVTKPLIALVSVILYYWRSFSGRRSYFLEVYSFSTSTIHRTLPILKRRLEAISFSTCTNTALARRSTSWSLLPAFLASPHRTRGQK